MNQPSPGTTLARMHVRLKSARSTDQGSQPAIASKARPESSVRATPHDGEPSIPTRPTTSNPDRR